MEVTIRQALGEVEDPPGRPIPRPAIERPPMTGPNTSQSPSQEFVTITRRATNRVVSGFILITTPSSETHPVDFRFGPERKITGSGIPRGGGGPFEGAIPQLDRTGTQDVRRFDRPVQEFDHDFILHEAPSG